jgi:hypothetical protein
MKFILKTLTKTSGPLYGLYFEALSGDVTIELKNRTASLGFNVGQHYEASSILAHVFNADTV